MAVLGLSTEGAHNNYYDIIGIPLETMPLERLDRKHGPRVVLVRFK